MGLLDQVIGGVLGQVLGGGRGGGANQGGGSFGGGGLGGGGLGGAMSPIVQALLMLLMQKGAGGLGDILGGGRPSPQGREDREEQPQGHDDGDIGGFGQDRGGRDDGGYADHQPQREGDYGDLAGMLDGPGERGAGRGQAEPGGHAGGHDGFDGLIDRFQRGGLGDVMESWIGPGQNRAVAPNQLADALGPDAVNALQSKTGLGRDDLLSQLAQALPGVIDGLTPQGRRPSADERRGW